MKKIIIALEGIDGAGKSTVTKFLVDKYKSHAAVYERTRKNKLIDKVVSCNFLRKYYKLQVPIYIYLSHMNLMRKKFQVKRNNIIIMDRCFLSNICYFFPNSLDNQKLFNFIMHFEPRIFPQKIFVLDVTPSVAQIRDIYKKDLEWLKNTRTAYLDSQYSKNLIQYGIEVLDENLSIEEKAKRISDYIQEEIKNGN